MTLARPIPKTLFWIHVRFLWHKTEQLRTKNSEWYVSGTISKKLYFKIFGRAISNCHTQTSLLKETNPGRKYMTGLEFSQRATVCSNITVTNKKIWKTTFPMPHVRETSISWRAAPVPRLQKSVGLPLRHTAKFKFTPQTWCEVGAHIKYLYLNTKGQC